MSSNNGKPQLHQSMLTMLSKCPIQFQRRYGARFGLWHEEEISKPAFAMALGTAVDESVNHLMDKKVRSEETSLEEVLAIARDTADREWQGGLLLTDEESENIEQTHGDLIDWSVRMTKEYVHAVAPSINPVEVQFRWFVELEGFPFDLAGTIDLVEAMGVLRDTKTSGNAVSKEYAKSIQAMMYAYGWYIQTGKQEFPKEFHFDVLQKKDLKRGREVAYHLRSVEPRFEWIDTLTHRLRAVAEFLEQVRTGKATFLPVTPNDMSRWICSSHYCGYWDTCKYRLDY